MLARSRGKISAKSYKLPTTGKKKKTLKKREEDRDERKKNSGKKGRWAYPKNQCEENQTKHGRKVNCARIRRFQSSEENPWHRGSAWRADKKKKGRVERARLLSHKKKAVAKKGITSGGGRERTRTCRSKSRKSSYLHETTAEEKRRPPLLEKTCHGREKGGASKESQVVLQPIKITAPAPKGSLR